MTLDVESVDLLLSTQRWVGCSDASCERPFCVPLDSSANELTGHPPGHRYWPREEAFWYDLERNHLSSYVVIYKWYL